MVNWKVYEILGMEKCQRFVRFDLNDHVNFREWSGNAICFDNAYPFNAWQIGDCLEIDLDATLCQSWAHEFSNTNMAKKVSSASLQRRVRELESRLSSSESNSSTQLVLRRNAETEKNDLQVAKRNLESKNYDLQKEKDSLQSSNWYLQTTNNDLREDLRKKDEDIKWGKGQLVIKEKEKEQLKNERDDFKNKWVLSDKEVKKITDSFNALQLEKREKETEIASLREELGNSQNIDLRYRERKLDESVRNLGLNRERIDNLRSAYERLKRASDPENYNQESITNAQNEIDNIKRELFQTNVNIDDLHKIYKVCEKVAELRVKQEKIRQQQQQQYHAHQEQPTNN